MYIQNLNGINTNDIEGNFEEITAHMREIQADIICFQENNLHTKQQKIRKCFALNSNKNLALIKTKISNSTKSYPIFIPV